MSTRDSSERFWRRGSTEMPIVGASLRGMPASYVDSQHIHLAFDASTSVTNLQLGKCEATSGAHTSVVLDRRATHDWSQSIDGTRCDFGSFLDASTSTSLLAGRL